MNGASIIAVGSCLPKNIVTNNDLSKKIDTTDEWIKSRTGIQQRHVISDNENTLSLAKGALLAALNNTSINKDEIDGVIVATTTPAQIMPSTACLLQGELGLKPGLGFDINAACSGFVYAINLADVLIRGGFAKTIAVIGSETMSKLVDWNDRKTSILFGDGAGAVIVQKSSQKGILGGHIEANGSHSELLLTKGGIYQPLSDNCYLTMDGREVFKHAVKTLEELVPKTLSLVGLGFSDIDWLIPHQANLRIINSTAKLLQLPSEKVIKTIEQHANTSAASIPLAIDWALRSGKIQKGDIALLEAFGAGFTWGSCIVRF